MTDRTTTQIDNRDATPLVLNDSRLWHGTVRSAKAFLTTGATDTAASIYRLCEVPSNAMIEDIFMRFESLGTGAAFDLGIYQTTANGGAVVDADLFGSAISAAAAVSWTAYHTESGVYSIDEMVKPLWEVLGLSADPRRKYDICMTLTGATTVAAKVFMLCRYTDGGS